MSRIIKISDKLRDDKGVTLITLIIAITIFAVFITVFSYVMVAKHGSASLYVQSTQAYAVAQAGIEYGIRYAADNVTGLTGFFTNPASFFPGTAPQSFGDGSFTLDYNDIYDVDRPNSLKSTGTVGVAKREIILEHFASWVSGGAITLVPSSLPEDQADWKANTLEIPLLIDNYGENVYIFRIVVTRNEIKSANVPQLKAINLGTTVVNSTEVWSGVEDFNTTDPRILDFTEVTYYTMASGSAMLILGFKNAADTDETWSCTFWYTKQVEDLSDPSKYQSSLIRFVTL